VTTSGVIKTYFWQLHTYSVVRVYRDDAFLRDKVYAPLSVVWEKLVAYKADRTLYDAEICTRVVSRTARAAKVSISIATSSRTTAPKLESYAFREDTVIEKEIDDEIILPPLARYAFLSDDA
jgi:hypothetical protein